MSASLQFRRVFLENEVNALIPLQRNASVFQKHYPKHSQWLNAAVKDIIAGNRTAFGAFQIAFDKHGDPEVSIVGCVILTRPKYSNTVELKNLYVAPHVRKQSCGRSLIQLACEYCIKAGFSRLITEVPCEESVTVLFLHKMGFRMTSAMPSPYQPGNLLYQLEKDLPPAFRGDPFDDDDFVRWLLSLMDMNPEVIDIEPGIFRFNAFSNVRGLESVKLNGVATVVRNRLTEAQRMHLESNETNVAFAFGYGDMSDAKDIRGLKVIDLMATRLSLASLFAYGFPRFSVEDVGGFIVSLNPAYVSRIKQDESTQFAFIKSGTVGKFLKPGMPLYFYEESGINASPGLRMVAKVAKIIMGSPEDVWRELCDAGPLFTEEEFRAFSRGKDEVIGFCVSQVRLLPEAISLPNEVTGDWADAWLDMGHIYVSTSGSKLLGELTKPSVGKSNLETTNEDWNIQALQERLRIVELNIRHYEEEEATYGGVGVPVKLVHALDAERKKRVELLDRLGR